MNIGIGSLNDRPSVTESPRSGVETPSKNSPDAGKTSAQIPESGGVSLDGSARLQRQMAAISGEGAPMDVEHIERLRSAIASGEYTVDLRGLASKLLTRETEVFGR